MESPELERLKDERQVVVEKMLSMPDSIRDPLPHNPDHAISFWEMVEARPLIRRLRELNEMIYSARRKTLPSDRVDGG
jgi:hypothetical protein